MSKESPDEGSKHPDEQSNNEGMRVGAENPYVSPYEGSRLEANRQKSGFAAAMKSLGLVCAVLLLVVVVVFGLFIGCCGMGMSGMQGN